VCLCVCVCVCVRREVNSSYRWPRAGHIHTETWGPAYAHHMYIYRQTGRHSRAYTDKRVTDGRGAGADHGANDGKAHACARRAVPGWPRHGPRIGRHTTHTLPTLNPTMCASMVAMHTSRTRASTLPKDSETGGVVCLGGRLVRRGLVADDEDGALEVVHAILTHRAQYRPNHRHR
jgi:hypothetical protein